MLERGALLGRFRIVDVVGRGATGTVYRAEDVGGGRLGTVALKVLRSGGEEAAAREFLLWRRELDALGALEHPGIVRLVDCGEHEGALYIATEFAEGETLDLYRRRERPPAKVSLRVAKDVASALGYAHERGIVHLDLKPRNIMVSGSPFRVKVLDFGLAQFLAERSPGLGGVTGTYLYMAPEQFGGMQPGPGPQSDLYALGVVLYELLTGCLPYESQEPVELIQDKLRGRCRPLSELLPGLHGPVYTIVSRLLAVQAEHRYRDAWAVAADLSACLDAMEGGQEGGGEAGGRRGGRAVFRPGFVGRAEERGLLSEAFESCRRGKGRVVLISGAAGIGKTRLAEEFGGLALAAGGILLKGKGTKATRAVPFYPLLSAVSEYLEATELRAAGDEALTATRESLSGLVAHLLGKNQDAVLELDVDRGQECFYNMLVNRVVGLARPRSPLVLMLDDLQWMDASMIEFVERMAAVAEQMPLLVLCLYRDERLDPASRLGRMVSHVGPAALSLPLRALGQGEVQELAGQAVGMSADASVALAGYLLQHAGGNPLDTIGLVNALLRKGAVQVEEQQAMVDLSLATGGPRGEEGVRPGMANMAVLEADVKEALQWASVLGDRFDPRLLSQIMDKGEDEVERLVAAAAEHGVLRRTGESGYRFAHDEYYERAYGPLAAEERRDRHQRVGEVLERESRPDDAMAVVALAEHFARGRDMEKALRYSLAAGEVASRSHAHDAARRYLKTAVVLVGVSKRSAEEKREIERRVRQSLGDSYAAAGDYDFAGEQLDLALGVAESVEAKADVMGRRGVVHFKKGELEQSAARTERALAMLDSEIPPTRFGLLLRVVRDVIWLVTVGWWRKLVVPPEPVVVPERDRLRVALLNKLTFTYFFFDTERMAATHLIAMRLAQKMTPCPETLEAVSQHGVVLCNIRLVERSLASVAASVSVARQMGQPGPLMVALFYAGLTNYFLARWDAALGFFREALALYQKTGDVFTLILAHENTGFTLYRRGELDGALNHLRRALELSHDVGDLRGETVADIFLARVYRLLGDLRKAAEHADAAARRVGSVRDNSVQATVLQAQGEVHLACGEREQGVRCLVRSIEIIEAHRLLVEYVAEGYCTLAEALLASRQGFEGLSRQGKRDMEERVRRLLARGAAFGRCFPAHAGPVLRARGLLELRLGNVRKAKALLTRAVRILEPLQMRYELARTYEVLAEALSDSPIERAGAEALSRQLAAEMGLNRHLPEAAVLGRQPAGGEAAPRAGEPGGAGKATSMRALIDVGRELASMLELPRLLERVMDAAVAVTGAERGLLVMAERRGARPTVRVSRMALDVQRKVVTDMFSTSVIDRCLRSGEALLVADAMLDPRFAAADSVLAQQLRSVLCLPLRAGGVVVGALYLENNSAGSSFGPLHLDIVRILGAQASVAIENSLAHARIEELNRELEGRVEVRTRELANTAQELEGRNRDLVEAMRQLKETQAALIHQEKMATLGRMAAGTTHEINNPLNFIHGGAYMLNRKLLEAQKAAVAAGAQGAEVLPHLEQMAEMSGIIVNGCDRIKGIVDAMWRLARGTETPPQMYDVRLGLESALKLVMSQERPGVEVMTQFGHVPQVLCSPTELDQVFLNLLMNALDAMGGPGRLTVKTRMDAEWVLASVQDTGPGIKPEDRQKIFEPFFTTKPVGKGTGLGLAICLGIVQKHGGTIEVDSEPGKGATFTVRLPARRDAPAAAAPGGGQA